jgi:IPT/TIG domain-containing protein
MRVAALVLSVVGSMGLAGPVHSEAAKPPKPPKPSVTKVTPASGPVAGGVTVKVKGTNLTGAKKVLFGSTKGTQLKVKSAKKLTVVAPAHAAGMVDVVVVTKGGKSKKVKGDVFTYVATTPTTPPVTPPPPPAAAGPVTAPLPGNASSGTSAVTDVACPAAGSCLAVGFYGTMTAGRHALLETLSAGTWSPTELPLPAGASTTNPNANLSSISCPSATFCAAVGEYDDAAVHRVPLFETWNGTTWTATGLALPAPASDTPFMDTVACSGAGTCTAVGRYSETSKNHPLIATLAAGTWTFQTVPLPSGATEALLSDVACPAAQCVAVGTVTPASGPPRPLTETGSGSTWAQQTPALPGDGAVTPSALLSGVSCASATVCVAVGSYDTNVAETQGLIETLGSGTWTPSTVTPPAGAADNPRAILWDVSCPSVVYCAASGYYLTTSAYDSSQAMVVTITSGTPTASVVSLPGAHPTAPQASVNNIVCPAFGSCAGVGSYQVSGGQNVGLLARVSGSVRPGVQASSPVGATSLSLNGLAADTATTAVAVGGYSSPSGGRGVLLTGVPVGPPPPS